MKLDDTNLSETLAITDLVSTALVHHEQRRNMESPPGTRKRKRQAKMRRNIAKKSRKRNRK